MGPELEGFRNLVSALLQNYLFWKIESRFPKSLPGVVTKKFGFLIVMVSTRRIFLFCDNSFTVFIPFIFVFLKLDHGSYCKCRKAAGLLCCQWYTGILCKTNRYALVACYWVTLESEWTGLGSVRDLVAGRRKWVECAMQSGITWLLTIPQMAYIAPLLSRKSNNMLRNWQLKDWRLEVKKAHQYKWTHGVHTDRILTKWRTLYSKKRLSRFIPA